MDKSPADGPVPEEVVEARKRLCAGDYVQDRWKVVQNEIAKSQTKENAFAKMPLCSFEVLGRSTVFGHDRTKDF